MIPTILTLFGAFYGAYRAKKLGGKPMDQLQFAVGFGIAFFILAMLAGTIVDNLLR